MHKWTKLYVSPELCKQDRTDNQWLVWSYLLFITNLFWLANVPILLDQDPCYTNCEIFLVPPLEIVVTIPNLSFPDSSVGKESTCNAGDPSVIPGSGKSLREGIGYPLQYSWASLVAQLLKNPLAMQETWVRSLGWEYPPEKGKATHSSILAWRIPWTV